MRVATGSRRAYAIPVFLFVLSTLCQRPSFSASVLSPIPVRSVMKCRHSASSWTSSLFDLPGRFIALHLSVRAHNWGAIRDVVSCPHERPAAPGGSSRMAGRRRLSPRRMRFPPRFFSRIQHGVAEATSRGRCSRTSFVPMGWDDHHDAAWDREAETISPHPAVFFKPSGDGEDAVSAALSLRRRRFTGETPDQTDAMGSLGPPNGASSWPAACASRARQVKSRADMARVIAAAGEAKATVVLMCPVCELFGAGGGAPTRRQAWRRPLPWDGGRKGEAAKMLGGCKCSPPMKRGGGGRRLPGELTWRCEGARRRGRSSANARPLPAREVEKQACLWARPADRRRA